MSSSNQQQLTPDQIHEKLKDVNLFICTPMYGGQCLGLYAIALCGLCQILTQLKVKFTINTITNESLITRARNGCVAHFLAGDYTHLLFWDADIGADPIELLKFLIVSHEKMCVGGVYPTKQINWNKVRGILQQDPNISNENLHMMASNLCMNLLGENLKGRENLDVVNGHLLEVENIPTGMMLINRKLFEKLIKKITKLGERENHIWVPDSDILQNIKDKDVFWTFFDTMVHPVSKRFLSEDWAFCNKVKKYLNIPVYAYLGLDLTHTGTMTFRSNLLKELDFFGNFSKSLTKGPQENKTTDSDDE